MTALIALIRKDLILYRDNKRALMLNLVMPILLAAFFGSLFGGSGSSAPSKVDVGLVQQDQSDIGRKLAAGLKADADLNVTELGLDQAREQVRKGKLPVAIVIPPGFGEQAGAALFSGRDKPQVPLYYDPSQSTVLAMVKGMLTQQVMQSVTADMFSSTGSRKYVDQALERLRSHPLPDAQQTQLTTFLDSLKTFQTQRAATTAASAAGASDAASASGGGMTMPFATQDQALSSGPKYNGYAHSFAGMGVQFILFMGIDMGIGVLLAQRTGIWNRQLAAPVTLTTVLLGRAISGALIALGLLCAIFLAATLCFKVQISNPLGFLGVALCFASMTTSFGLMIAAYGKTPEAARGVAVFATLILVMLGGAWVPSFIFPQWMQSLTLLVPTRWAVDGFDAMTWRGLGADAALKSMAVQLGFAIVFATLAITKFRRDQQ
jgi:ABC-2 type transport system permease protein